MPRLLALVIVLIVYGSLYPWHFVNHSGGPVPVIGWLLSSPGAFYPRDALVNVVFYMPVGACAFLAFRPRLAVLMALLTAVLLGTALSFGVEVAQAFEASRRTNIVDVYANALGSGLGAAVAVTFSNVSHGLHRRLGPDKSDAGALVLILCWLAYLLYPYLPIFSVAELITKLREVDKVAVLPFLSAAAAWLVIAHAAKAAGIHGMRVWMSLLLVPAQLLINQRQPTFSELGGAIVGVALARLTLFRSDGRMIAAVAMMLLLLVRGLFPIEWTASPRHFEWVPFASLLQGDWKQASQMLSEKLFFYGAAIWSLHYAGVRLRTAVVATAVILSGIEGAQVWLPRTAEITDPLLAIMIGFGLDTFRPGSVVEKT